MIVEVSDARLDKQTATRYTTPMTTSLIETPRCFHCGNKGFLELPDEGIAKYEAGALIQNAFPELPAPIREQIISGTHPECWEQMFAPFGEDEDDEDE